MEDFSKAPKGVESKKTSDGGDNPKYVDLLDEDKPIAGQKFVCLSFISPEHILKQKEHFYFEQFVKHWDIHKSMDKFLQFLNFVAYKYKISFDKLTADFQEFKNEEKENIIKTSITEDYKTFLDQNEDKLEEQFGEKHEFQTSVRGIKVRGVYPSQKEAEMRCKLLREVDPNHDIFVGQVGIWVPFHPEAYKTGRVEYMEETLNQLMSEKKKNEEQAKQEFDKRVKEAKMKAIEENKKLAEKSGNKLTQTITADGELVGVSANSAVDFVADPESNMTFDEVHKQLFEGKDAVMDQNTDHGLSQLENLTFNVGENNEEHGEEV